MGKIKYPEEIQHRLTLLNKKSRDMKLAPFQRKWAKDDAEKLKKQFDQGNIVTPPTVEPPSTLDKFLKRIVPPTLQPILQDNEGSGSSNQTINDSGFLDVSFDLDNDENLDPTESVDELASTNIVTVSKSKQDAVNQLMTFLVTQPFVEDQDTLVHLGREAGCRRNMAEVAFSGDIGYYIVPIDGRRRTLAAFVRRTDVQRKSDAQYEHNSCQEVKDRKSVHVATVRANKTKTFNFYLADVFTTGAEVQLCREGKLPWWTILIDPSTLHVLYPGIFSSIDGYICMRIAHFKKHADTLIWDRMVLIPTAICLELLALPCVSIYVMQQTEGFVMYYLRLWNVEYPDDQQIWLEGSPDAHASPELERKAEEYVTNKIRLYEIVGDDHPMRIPPYPHLATLEESTTLPFQIRHSALKERWRNGTRLDLDGNEVPNCWTN